MPMIHVLNATASSVEQKRELIAELTTAYARVMNMRPDTIRVIINEIPGENWGVAGVTLADSGQNESLAVPTDRPLF